MNEEDFKVFIEDFMDFLNGLEASIVKFRSQINKLVGSEAKEWNWNPDKIKWEKADGFKGEYERSEDVNSLDFKALLKDLAEHKGFLVRDSFSYWVFKNGSTVGRKKRGEAKP